MAAISSRILFNGADLPFYSWAANNNTYGSVGSFEIRTSMQSLRKASIDIYTESLESVAPVPVQIFVTDQYGNNDYLIFGGQLDRTEWDFNNDEVIITGRDWAGLLVDQKAALVDTTVYFNSTAGAGVVSTLNQAPGGYNITNMTIVEFLTQVANNFGFILDVDETYLTKDAQGNFLTLGQLQSLSATGSTMSVFTTSPKPIWDILVYLSRIASQKVPYEVSISPDKFLRFIPAASSEPITLSWNLPASKYANVPAPTNGLPAQVPLLSLHITHEPRRNSTFGVVVLTYHYASVSQGYGSLTYVNDLNYAKNSSTWQQFGVTGPGFYAGKNPYGSSGLLGSLGRPIYIVRARQGLNPTDVQNEAYRQVLEIAKKELIIEGTIDGIATLQTLSPFKINGTPTDLMGFDANGAGPRIFYFNHIEHRFTMPQTDNSEEGAGAGYVINFSAWTLPLTITLPGVTP